MKERVSKSKNGDYGSVRELFWERIESTSPKKRPETKVKKVKKEKKETKTEKPA